MKVSLAETIPDVRRSVAEARGRGLSIGLVPTMGALHAGHASLIRAAREETGYVVVSIFVNPTQFGPQEDYSRYPRSLESDLELCERERVDLVFAPGAAEIYPPGFRTFVEVQELQDVLCGHSRPGHFRGVATVVLKLFTIVQPNIAFFGQKDAQQARIIRQMVDDLDLSVQVRVCPIVREPDGLALSSRNQYLDAEQRREASRIPQALEEIRERIARGDRDATSLRKILASRLESIPGAVLDYAALVNADTLKPLNRLGGDVLVAVAVKFGATRLIDNILLSVADNP
jgi:pantoate--beta-alanine ligase